jgi:serine/threonine protein kinase
MNAGEGADRTSILSVAGSIARGSPVDWNELRRRVSDPGDTAVIAELEALEGVCRLSQPAPAQWGPFEIADEIGCGSFGTVYRATDSTLDLDVALKVIRFEADDQPAEIARALKEARLLAQITHPNVVRIYRAELIGHEVGVAMELIRGQTLEELVRRQGPFSAGEAVVIGLDLCRALAAVHGAGLLHCDVKARNVMRAEGGRTVLMDFGAGRDVKPGRRRTPGADVAGTPIYLAPEVFAGQGQSKASDIYSLGVLLYHLVTGSYPLNGRTREEIARLHAQHTPRTTLRDVRSDLPDAFIRVLDGALAENVRERYQSAGEFQEALYRVEHAVARPIRPRIRWKPLTIVSVGILSAALLIMRARQVVAPPSEISGESRAPGLPADRAAVSPAIAGSAAPYRIEASLYRAQDGNAVRLQQNARVSPGDNLFLELRSSVATHVYVVNEDDQGESYLLFPLPGQDASNPLAPGQRHRLPGSGEGQRYWQVTSAGGHEHFLIFASPDAPSPAFKHLFAALPHPAEGTPVVGSRLSADALAVLRGVGGLVSSPPSPGPPRRLTREFGAPLGEAEEAARGVWVRQITLENPKP